jgi:hypothetical protein
MAKDLLLKKDLAKDLLLKKDLAKDLLLKKCLILFSKKNRLIMFDELSQYNPIFLLVAT